MKYSNQTVLFWLTSREHKKHAWHLPQKNVCTCYEASINLIGREYHYITISLPDWRFIRFGSFPIFLQFGKTLSFSSFLSLSLNFTAANRCDFDCFWYSTLGQSNDVNKAAGKTLTRGSSTKRSKNPGVHRYVWKGIRIPFLSLKSPNFIIKCRIFL